MEKKTSIDKLASRTQESLATYRQVGQGAFQGVPDQNLTRDAVERVLTTHDADHE